MLFPQMYLHLQHLIFDHQRLHSETSMSSRASVSWLAWWRAGADTLHLKAWKKRRAHVLLSIQDLVLQDVALKIIDPNSVPFRMFEKVGAKHQNLFFEVFRVMLRVIQTSKSGWCCCSANTWRSRTSVQVIFYQESRIVPADCRSSLSYAILIWISEFALDLDAGLIV